MSYPVDSTAEFQPGNIAQLNVTGNEIVCGLSDGTAPLGIIDDVNSTAFTQPSVDEIAIVECVAAYDGYNLVAAADTEKRLREAHIVRSSFVSDVEGIVLYDTNGTIVVPAGTILNYDSDGDGVYDSVRVICSYIYRVSNIPGDNTTLGSGQITIWYQRGIFETDQYDTRQTYVVNATLFVNSNGQLTSAQPGANYPGIGMVTGPPSGIVQTLEFLWF
jgi:hypothetical protein